MRDRNPVIAWMRRFPSRTASLFTGRRQDHSMAEEMRLHLELQAEEYIKGGMSPEAAAAQARIDFGHLEGLKERCRDERGFPWVSQLVQDLRYGTRMLIRSPGFTLVAVLTLALGVGVNAGIFRLADKVLFRQLPVKDPDGLVLLRGSRPRIFPSRLTVRMNLTRPADE